MARIIALPHKPKWTEWPAMYVALHFALAPVSIAFALGLARVFIYFHWPQPFTGLALCAIAITFWYGSTQSGIFATLIASLVRNYFFQPETTVPARVLYDLVFLIFGY
jgi:hypothetical protein